MQRLFALCCAFLLMDSRANASPGEWLHEAAKGVARAAVRGLLKGLSAREMRTPGALVIAITPNNRRADGKTWDERSPFDDSHLPDPAGTIRIQTADRESFYLIRTFHDVSSLRLGIRPSSVVRPGARIIVVLNDNDDRGPMDDRLAQCIGSLPAPGAARRMQCGNSSVVLKLNP